MGNCLDKILPGLYVGGIRASSKKQILDDNNITHILSIHDRAAPYFKDRQYLCITANDNSAQDLTQFFPECNDFIHQARLNGGNVLVHCFAGISRSVTVTTVYIMTITSLSWREALKAIRGARHCANPNFGFQRQLLAFYHDSLLEEKGRLFTKFPKRLQYEDEPECHRLIQAHEDWVLHGDEGPPGTPKDEDENTYPLRHNAYGIKTDKKSDKNEAKSPETRINTKEQTTCKDEGSLKVGSTDEKKVPENDDNDDDDDGAYIDMSKNSFQKPASPTTPVSSGTLGNSGITIPSCSEQTVKDYEDKLLTNTAKVMSHEKYHSNKHTKSLNKHSNNSNDVSHDGKNDSNTKSNQSLENKVLPTNSQTDQLGCSLDREVKSANTELAAVDNVISKDPNHKESIIDELFSGNHRGISVLTQSSKDEHSSPDEDCSSKSDKVLSKCCTSHTDIQQDNMQLVENQNSESRPCVPEMNASATEKKATIDDTTVDTLFEVNLVTR